MLWFHRLANLFFRLCFWVLFDYHVEGLENVPLQGALIVAINHFSFVDPLLAGTFIRRPITMMGKAELFRVPIFGRLVRMYGAIPVRRGEGDHVALRKSLEVLRSDGALLIAPEGTRGKEGTLKPGREGMALIALRTGATILPIAIWGPKTMWQNMKRLRRTEVHMVVGRPFKPRSPAGRKASRAELVALTDEIMGHIATLLPPEYRGVYAGAVAGERLATHS
jgi:1-acyl-sn-glycerol-3-phosphate acyltransferase